MNVGEVGGNVMGGMSNNNNGQGQGPGVEGRKERGGKGKREQKEGRKGRVFPRSDEVR